MPLSIFGITFSALRQKSGFWGEADSHFPLWSPKGKCEAGETLECMRVTSLMPYTHFKLPIGVVRSPQERNVVSCLGQHDEDTTETHSETQSTRTQQTVVRGDDHIPMQHRYHVLGQRGARGSTPNMCTRLSRENSLCVTQTAHVETRRQQQRSTKTCERVDFGRDPTPDLRHSRLDGLSVRGSACGG